MYSKRLKSRFQKGAYLELIKTLKYKDTWNCEHIYLEAEKEEFSTRGNAPDETQKCPKRL